MKKSLIFIIMFFLAAANALAVHHSSVYSEWIITDTGTGTGYVRYSVTNAGPGPVDYFAVEFNNDIFGDEAKLTAMPAANWIDGEQPNFFSPGHTLEWWESNCTPGEYIDAGETYAYFYVNFTGADLEAFYDPDNWYTGNFLSQHYTTEDCSTVRPTDVSSTSGGRIVPEFSLVGLIVALAIIVGELYILFKKK